MSLPNKYTKAHELLKARDEEGFIAFATNNKLAYDVANHVCESLISAAASRRLWRCVDFMVDGASVTFDDVAKTYGYAPQSLSERMWQAFVATNNGVPRTVKQSEFHNNSVPLITAVAEAGCHDALIKLLVPLGSAPNTEIPVRTGGSLPLVLWCISSDRINTSVWTPEAFDWLLATFPPEKLGIADRSIEQLLYDWGFQYSDFAQNCFEDGEEKAVATERVFWKLEEMHTDKKAFATRASKISARDAPRFAKVLACFGVGPGTPDASIVTETVCPHCKGAGKVNSVDESLVQEAKKRRVAEISAK